MKEFTNNEATRFLEDEFFGYDFENAELPNKETMEALDPVSNFERYVRIHAKRCGYTEDTQDAKQLSVFVANKCKEAGIKLGDRPKTTLDNWLTKGLPANTGDGREYVYRLCFALEMNEQQTAEFFLKAYLERPFYYKNIREAVYFFCFRKGLKYCDAERILKCIEEKGTFENSHADEITAVIGTRLQEINDEAELVRYIYENRAGFDEQNKTAFEKIEELKKNCMEIAPKEHAININNAHEEITVTTIDELLSVIYGYSARATEKGKAVYKESISKSKFPKLVKKNWPLREQFAQILEKKNASYDVIRRALIMLAFYDFAANATVAKALECGIFDELIAEINTILAECGYVQLYWKNPFDWMIGYCAVSPNPLGTLRDLIEEYYLNDLEDCDQTKK